jgi:hypothetical protein
MWVLCHDEIVEMASKKHGTIRQMAESADSPIDFVLAAGTVREPQDFISEKDFSLIDFWGRIRSSQGCRSQLIKPTELALAFYFNRLREVCLRRLEE